MTDVLSQPGPRFEDACLKAWRPVLLRFGDEILPADLDGFPTVSEVVARGDRALRRVVKARPDFCQTAEVLPRSEHLAQLRLADLSGEVLIHLRQFVAGLYFTDPEVCRLLGYTGQNAEPLPDIRQALEDLADLLVPVFELNFS